jgi:hypothetical protein
VADAAAAWSPRHGRFILSAAAAESGPGTALWTVDSGGRIESIAGSEGAVGPVAVGPGGAIAVTLRRSGEPAAGIGVLPPAAAAMTRLAPSSALDDRWPSFSPNGGEILIGRTFVERPLEADGIWSVDLATGVARQLATDGAYARWLP